ncbi:hypothetical protein K438DRAFT_1834092 [Mycena galopus ATCC 62051]|nr:hypothetical protein K438DRAFT_1834092 [Mycena galopus ATCC 62051]
MATLGTTEAILRILIMAETLRLLKELVKLRTNLMPGPVPSPPLVTYNILYLVADVVFATNNFVVDSLFLYRCYVIWGRQKKVLIVPGVFMISTVILGCVAGIIRIQDINLEPTFLTASFIMAAATNLVLVTLTAGRIWVTRRDAIHIGADNTLRNRYSTAITTIVESGAIYCLCAILSAVTNTLKESTIAANIAYIVIDCTSAQLMNILPTLIIVRAAMGHNIQDKIEPRSVPRTTPRRAVQREHLSSGILDLKPSIDSEEEAIV